MKLNISEFFLYLLTEKNFYARVANSMQRVESPGLGTMGVGIRNGRIVLFYDPEFVAKISLPTGIFVIEHEILHIVLDHIPRYFEMLAQAGNDMEFRAKAEVVYNIAMDCADNDILRKSEHFEKAEKETRDMQMARIPVEARGEVPKEALERFGMVLPEKHNMPLGKAFEFYQSVLMHRVVLLPPEAVAKLLKEWTDLLGDSHKNWADGDAKGDGKEGENNDGNDTPGGGKGGILPEEAQGLAHQLRTQLKQMLRTAVRDQQKSRGTIPANISEWLEEYLADPIVPWWEILTTRIKSTKRSKPDRGIARPNRMLLAMSEEDETVLPALGVVRDPIFRVFFYVDTSGSMDSESLFIARGELSHLLHTDEDLEVRYMQGDCTTQYDELFRAGQTLPHEVYGRGGTDFDEYFRYMGQYVSNDETAPDIVIVYTDGYAPRVNEEYRLSSDTPVIWLVTKNHAAESLKDYGEIIVCDPDQNEMWKHQGDA